MQDHDQQVRTDEMIDGESGWLFLRRVEKSGSDGTGRPILLIHGARVPGVPSFDLPVQGGSLAADLAGAGFSVFIGDLRGYGYSDRPAAMFEDPASSKPLVRVRDAARDIGAMVAWISGATGHSRVTLLGWATGGMWCGYFASTRPEAVERLVLYNALYRSPDHPSLGHGSGLEDPEHPGRFAARASGGYRVNAASSLLGAWDSSIPTENVSDWRDPGVAESYIREALRSDRTAEEREPPGFRAPIGALEDSFYQAIGRQLYDASLIERPTLIIAGERDFWSQPVDRDEFSRHFNRDGELHVHVVPNGTHFMHLDRPQAGRAEFLRVILDFLA
ncbi:alpha/beta fold hydrolase [soil metagenome]